MSDEKKIIPGWVSDLKPYSPPVTPHVLEALAAPQPTPAPCTECAEYEEQLSEANAALAAADAEIAALRDQLAEAVRMRDDCHDGFLATEAEVHALREALEGLRDRFAARAALDEGWAKDPLRSREAQYQCADFALVWRSAEEYARAALSAQRPTPPAHHNDSGIRPEKEE